MPRFGVRPRSLAGALLPLFLIFSAAPPAAAGDVAGSAYAYSLAMPGLLLEAPWLIHLHPQLAALVPTQIGATGTGSYGSPDGVLAVVRSGDLALFGASQPGADLILIPASTDLVQLGAAARVGAMRLGLAVRGTVSQTDQSSLDQYPAGEPDAGFDTIQHGNRIEGAFGVGAGGDETFLDLTFEAGRERFDVTNRVLNSRDSLDVRIHGRPETRFGGAARVGFRGPFESRVQLAGTFRDRSARVETETVLPDSLVGVRTRDEYGHLWQAGLSATHDLEEGDLTFFAFYVNRDGPTRYDRLYSSYVERSASSDTDNVLFGIAHRRPFWWDTRLLVGFQNSFQLVKSRSYRESGVGTSTVDVQTTERIARSFAWGLQRSFERLDLTGSLRTNLPAGDLFGSLDAVYHL